MASLQTLWFGGSGEGSSRWGWAMGPCSKAPEPRSHLLRAPFFTSQPVSLKLNLVNLWNVCFSSLSWLMLPHVRAGAKQQGVSTSSIPFLCHCCHLFYLPACYNFQSPYYHCFKKSGRYILDQLRISKTLHFRFFLL